MPKAAPAQPADCYILPTRQLRGTRDEVLAQIDELILGLTGLRQLISIHNPGPVRDATAKAATRHGVWQPRRTQAQASKHLARGDELLAIGMILLGVITFGALMGFIRLCDRV